MIFFNMFKKGSKLKVQHRTVPLQTLLDPCCNKFQSHPRSSFSSFILLSVFTLQHKVSNIKKITKLWDR